MCFYIFYCCDWVYSSVKTISNELKQAKTKVVPFEVRRKPFLWHLDSQLSELIVAFFSRFFRYNFVNKTPQTVNVKLLCSIDVVFSRILPKRFTWFIVLQKKLVSFKSLLFFQQSYLSQLVKGLFLEPIVCQFNYAFASKQNIRKWKIAMGKIVWMKKNKAVNYLVNMILYYRLRVVHVLDFVCYGAESN